MQYFVGVLCALAIQRILNKTCGLVFHISQGTQGYWYFLGSFILYDSGCHLCRAALQLHSLGTIHWLLSFFMQCPCSLTVAALRYWALNKAYQKLLIFPPHVSKEPEGAEWEHLPNTVKWIEKRISCLHTKLLSVSSFLDGEMRKTWSS